jgi:FPC/CPF motif-containing protein YcgG
VRSSAFPCIGAKSALFRDQLNILIARDINSTWDDLRIYSMLLAFALAYKNDPRLFQSFAVVFTEGYVASEAEFERALWRRVQSLADQDAGQGHSYDERVSPDPGNPHFSLSFGGEAFFVVGLHPKASRAARRFERPTLVFNLHDQFERLRDDGRYETLRDKIIARDVALAGDINPMLARHGEKSEARQYSGRAVDDDWACPFTAPAKEHASAS